ncbi:hypothetical protein [Streptomyces phaeofaciens]|uniref:hypothetical protein n=1 Tax=Streptomyces phaeofaciens TaxID=68254 RepID=UPI0036A33013
MTIVRLHENARGGDFAYYSVHRRLQGRRGSRSSVRHSVDRRRASHPPTMALTLVTARQHRLNGTQ